MAHPSKRKGDTFERDIVNALNTAGIWCERSLKSGARSDGSDTYDIDFASGETAECKKRKTDSGLKGLLKWKGKANYLIVGIDRQPPIVVMEFDEFVKLKGLK